jgi:hypothetical protein
MENIELDIFATDMFVCRDENGSDTNEYCGYRNR